MATKMSALVGDRIDTEVRPSEGGDDRVHRNWERQREKVAENGGSEDQDQASVNLGADGAKVAAEKDEEILELRGKLAAMEEKYLSGVEELADAKIEADEVTLRITQCRPAFCWIRRNLPYPSPTQHTVNPDSLGEVHG